MTNRLFAKIGVATLLFSCAFACSTPQSRIKENEAKFASYSPEAQAQIQNGRIDVGFTEEMVFLAKGKPLETASFTDKNGKAHVVWRYRGSAQAVQSKEYSTGLSGGYGYPDFGRGPQPVMPVSERRLYKIEFIDGKVASWDQELQIN